MSFQVKINKQGEARITELDQIRRDLFRQACEFDGIDPSSAFVEFSDTNPFVGFLDTATKQLFEAKDQFRSGGYVGLSTRKGKRTK